MKAIDCGATKWFRGEKYSVRSNAMLQSSCHVGRHQLCLKTVASKRFTMDLNNHQIRTSSALQSSVLELSYPKGSSEKLDNFVAWLVNNGVEGIGLETSKVGLYASEHGERGLLALKDCAAKEVLLKVPLRLAFTDHAADEESNAVVYEGAPWSVRLACKLLRADAAGFSNPWFPYIQVLPESVPSPPMTFSWEEMCRIYYEPITKALHEYEWLVQDTYERCSTEAKSGADLERFRWAMSVVHSRTFGNAAPGGGVGVRMLVPLIDMINHGGDEMQDAVGSSVRATDNVRWDLAGPESSGLGCWAMQLSATRDIATNEELLLSYGERDNDDFFLHYGFVPPRNPHDAVELFSNLEEALEWFYRQYEQSTPWEEVEAKYMSALAVGQAEQDQERRERLQSLASASDGPSQDVEQSSKESQSALKILVGNRVSGALMAAFLAVTDQNKASAEAAVADRCRQVLEGLAPGLVDSLTLLGAAEEASGSESSFYRAQARRLQAIMSEASISDKILIPPVYQELLAHPKETLTHAQKLTLTYLISKQMILVDCIVQVRIGSRVSPGKSSDLSKA